MVVIDPVTDPELVVNPELAEWELKPKGT